MKQSVINNAGDNAAVVQCIFIFSKWRKGQYCKLLLSEMTFKRSCPVEIKVFSIQKE